MPDQNISAAKSLKQLKAEERTATFARKQQIMANLFTIYAIFRLRH